MKPPKRKQDQWNPIKLLGRFLARHGEKILAAVILMIAFWIAWQAFGYRPLSWQSDQLADLADSTKETITNNRYTIADENLTIFDYAHYAEQIKEQILSAPYRSETAWKPVLHPDQLPRGGFEILTAEALKGEAVRRIHSITGGKTQEWQRPPSPTATDDPQYEHRLSASPTTSLWVNLYGTLPLRQQWDIYNQTFDEAIETNRPEYVYYELERAKINSTEKSAWLPVIIYPSPLAPPDHDHHTNPHFDLLWDRLIPLTTSFTRQQGTLETSHDLGNLLLFSDFNVEPATTYAYRLRLYLTNPNYNIQESFVEEGVDTKSKFVRSDWSAFARIYVPDRTTIRLQSVTPTDGADFPRQLTPLRPISGTLFLDYFDIELGQFLPPIEKKDIRRGALGNIPKEDAIRYINRIDNITNINYPDNGLRSDVCIMDFSGGKKLQKRTSRESQGTPDLSTPSKALLLMPDGTIQTTSTTPNIFN